MNFFRKFLRQEDGLVTVEWVALTASIVIAAIVVSFSIMHNTNTVAKTLATGIPAAVISVYGPNGKNL